ncbi:hypothetical protein PQX77_005296 [Marasmius sp. AFHP31]|nr:hypothetical protein PQX77_005296 [Marasmius sp. AFHP31]
MAVLYTLAIPQGFLLFTQAILTLLAALVAHSVTKRVVLYRSTQHLAGPPYAGFVAGNFKESLDDEKAVVPNQWIAKYGKVFRTWGLLGAANVYMADLKGLSHILKHDTTGYMKPDYLQFMLSRVTGRGLLVVDGEDHRRQRKVMNPAFGLAEIRALTETFLEKSFELRDSWKSLLENSNVSRVEVDALHWLSRVTVDIIGQAGFSYQLCAVSGEYNEVNEAFSKVFATGNFFTPNLVLKLMFPRLRGLPETDGGFRRAQSTTSRIARELYERSKTTVEKTGSSHERDLFSLLIKSNMSMDVPPGQRMNEEEVLARTNLLGCWPRNDKASPLLLTLPTTFKLTEVHSTATTLALYLLCTRPEVQLQLRAELLSVPTDSPSMDQLNALPYLDAVIREILRILSPIQTTVRIAMKDDVIPLSQPFVDRYGKQHDHLEVKKGQPIVVPILAINKDKSLWGEDAEEFKPERWEELPKGVSSIPGVWGNMMTFLGGPRACIGWRFTIVE